MRLKVMVAGVLAGVAMFFWGFLSHMVLGIGDLGVENLPAAESLVPTLQSGITQSGLYMYPPMDKSHAPEAEAQWYESAKQGWGVVIHSAAGKPFDMTASLIKQMLNCVCMGLLLAILLSCALGTLPTLLCRLSFVVGMGVLTWLTVNVPNWNWYGFPETFTLGQLADRVGEFVFAGVVLALMIKPK